MKFCEMTKPEIEKILSLGNLTKDEEQVFIFLAKGYTRIQIQDRLLISSATIGRIKRRIEKKAERLFND